MSVGASIHPHSGLLTFSPVGWDVTAIAPRHLKYILARAGPMHKNYELQGVSRLLSFLTHPFSRTYVDAAGCPFIW